MAIEELFATGYIGEHDTDTHRICGTCGILKPVEAFYKDGKYSNGKTRYRRDCRECYKKQRLIESKAKRKKVRL